MVGYGDVGDDEGVEVEELWNDELDVVDLVLDDVVYVE